MFRHLIVLFAAMAAVLGFAFAKDPINTGRFSNLAIGGYDAVSYFTDGTPTKGDKEFTFEYQGAEWRFSSAKNLETFTADPTAYAPQYGGYCAWAVSQNYTAPGDPKIWKIVDNKLYLNYNKKVQDDWKKDIPGFIKLANENWPGVIN
ncbi:YHS domain-containing (seleno)protein [Hyphococcus lacteus]|uniref:YHS domain-containing (Seleno)protein n=1 Tax=Hyphococcus lacteus TaxID=3143536 RepID=A0ABV3Z6N6_9PROT